MENKKVLRFKELKLEVVKASGPVPSSAFDASRNRVPPFREKDVDKYFMLFEHVATSLNWPMNACTLLLPSVLTGEAQEA